MKKLTLTIIALMMLTSVSAQNTQKNDTLQFMTAYRQFAAFVEKQPTFTKTMADSLIARQDTLIALQRNFCLIVVTGWARASRQLATV